MVTNSSFKGDRSKKFLKSTKIVSEYHKQHYSETQKRVAQGEPFIWTNVGVPMELMFAMDIPILFNLNWSALIAAKQMSPHYLNVLNNEGYFRDLCRYCSLPLGYFFDTKPGEGPWGGVPRPAALVVEAIDDPIVRIWELAAKKLHVPLYLWDRTFAVEPPKDNAFYQTPGDYEAESYRETWRVDYAVKETEGLISFLETLTGKTLREVKLREVMERSNEQFDYIRRVLDLCATAPAVPMGIGDHMANLITTQFYRGHEFGLAQAKRLYDEVKERVDQGMTVCEHERVRLMQFGVPIWFSPGFYDSFQEEYGAVFAWNAYLPVSQQWIRRDLRDPLRALASRYVNYAEASLPPYSLYFFIEEAKKYRIDGVVYQKAESCRFLSFTMHMLIKAFEDIGIPTFVLASDYVDARDWDDAKMKSQLGGFIETLF